MTERLLPISATPQEVALEMATARIELVPVPVRDMWDPDAIPARHLPWLAWAFDVPAWDPAWTEEQRRNAIKGSIAVHRARGTAGAVIAAISALFRGARIQEWYEQTPQLRPYTFDLVLEVTEDPLDRPLLQHLVRVVQATKNLRSHLHEIKVSAKTTSSLYAGGALGVGMELAIGDAGPAGGSEPEPVVPLVLDGTWTLNGSQELDAIKNA